MPKGAGGGGVKNQMHTFCMAPATFLNNHTAIIMFLQVSVNSGIVLKNAT